MRLSELGPDHVPGPIVFATTAATAPRGFSHVITYRLTSIRHGTPYPSALLDRLRAAAADILFRMTAEQCKDYANAPPRES